MRGISHLRIRLHDLELLQHAPAPLSGAAAAKKSRRKARRQASHGEVGSAIPQELVKPFVRVRVGSTRFHVLVVGFVRTSLLLSVRLRRRRVEDDVSLTAIRDRDPASPSNEP